MKHAELIALAALLLPIAPLCAAPPLGAEVPGAADYDDASGTDLVVSAPETWSEMFPAAGRKNAIIFQLEKGTYVSKQALSLGQLLGRLVTEPDKTPERTYRVQYPIGTVDDRPLYLEVAATDCGDGDPTRQLDDSALLELLRGALPAADISALKCQCGTVCVREDEQGCCTMRDCMPCREGAEIPSPVSGSVVTDQDGT